MAGEGVGRQQVFLGSPLPCIMMLPFITHLAEVLSQLFTMLVNQEQKQQQNVPGLEASEALSRGEGSGSWLAVTSALRGNLKSLAESDKGLGLAIASAWLTPARMREELTVPSCPLPPATELRLAMMGVSQAFLFGSPRDKVCICDMYS